jgi:hypothetical protein
MGGNSSMLLSSDASACLMAVLAALGQMRSLAAPCGRSAKGCVGDERFAIRIHSKTTI